MAKRRIKRARTSAKRSFFKRGTKRKSSSSKGESPMKIMLYGAGYGALRAPIAVMADSLLKKLPLPAQVTDEVGMGIASYFAYKKGKGHLKQLGKAGLYIESYRVSDTFVSPMVQNVIGGAMGSSNGSGIYIN